MTDLAGAEPTARTRVPTRWRAFASMFVFCFGMSSIWALATPLFSAPDEPSHVIRAVSIWTGDAFADRFLIVNPTVLMQVRVPGTIADANDQATCWAGKPERLPTCAPPYRADAATRIGETTSGLYPLGFLGSVGWIGALLPSPTGVYLMRLWAALECSLVFASIGLVLVDRALGRTALIGVALGVTPLAMSLAGSVNPNGFEIIAAVALWMHSWAWFSAVAAGERASTGLIIRAGVIAAALCVTRPVSPAICAVILLTMLVVCRCNPLRLWRDRATWLAVPLIAVGATTTLLWSLHITALLGRVHNLPPGGTTAFEGTFGLIGGQIPQMIGAFGWLDSGNSSVAVACWITAAVALATLAVLWGRAPERRGAAASLLLGSLFPVAVGFPGYLTSYLAWQGRYSLPIMAGLPILAGIALAVSSQIDPIARQRAITWLSVLVVIGHSGGLFWALKRVTVGPDGPNFWPAEMIWTPPVPLPMALMLVTFPAVCALGLWSAGRQLDGGTSGAGEHRPSSSTTSI